jgi:Tfp pilus assembly protein PilO
MNLTQREKILVFGTLGVLLLLVADYYVLTPFMERQDVLQALREQVSADMGHARKLAAERKELAPKWHSLVSNGLTGDPSEAEGQLLHAVKDWARESGFTLSSVKPDLPGSKEQLKEIHVQATGSGAMDGVARFLWKMQAAAFPLKVVEFQLGSRTDGTNDLSLQLKVSTLYLALEQKPAKAEKTGGGGAK